MYVKSLECASTNFATRFSNLDNLKPTFAFLVNQFVVDVVKDGCPVQKHIATQTANIEAGLLDLQQHLALKSVHQSSVEFWKQVSALTQTCQRHINIFWTTY